MTTVVGVGGISGYFGVGDCSCPVGVVLGLFGGWGLSGRVFFPVSIAFIILKLI